MDFTALLAAIDGTAVTAAIAAAAAVKMGPGVARWGFSKIISWFR